ncbi:hypothetical protein B0H13DRAFT_2316319 [Mycena leptocephala]|nr:hypothetical protein B0H13DRAFT_2316319 [Mycena leptocephala]
MCAGLRANKPARAQPSFHRTRAFRGSPYRSPHLLPLRCLRDVPHHIRLSWSVTQWAPFCLLAKAILTPRALSDADFHARNTGSLSTSLPQ